MNSKEIITGYIVFGCILLLGAWDLFANAHWGPSATISQFVWDLDGRYRIIGVLIGIVIGHLYFPIILGDKK